jgi:L-fuculose-phosphate aldolase
MSDRAQLAQASARVAAAGLVTGAAGNLSVRRGEHMLITARGAQLEAIDAATSVEVSLEDGSAPPGSRPSSESPLHRAVYAAAPDAGAIVHTHSHFATVLSTLVDELPPIHYAIHALGGTVRVARYETFGTQELAAAVTEALQDRRGALMANHGAIVHGRDLEHAVGLAVTLEWLASVYFHARLAGSPHILGDDDIDAVREQIHGLGMARR